MSEGKRNLFLTDTKEEIAFTSRRAMPSNNFPVRSNPKNHAKIIEDRLKRCRDKDLEQKQIAAIRYKEGLYLEFSGMEEKELNTKSLENIAQGVRLLNVRVDDGVTRATVYVPAGKEGYFLKKVEEYKKSAEEGCEKLKNNDLIRSIEDIKLAVVESFWIGDKTDLPNKQHTWCEVWLRYNRDDCQAAVDDFRSCCADLHIQLKEGKIVFPERVVLMIKANRQDLGKLLQACAYIAELRRAPEPTSFFDELSGGEQAQWVNDLKSRLVINDSNATVCLFDTGIAAHPLLESVIDENCVLAVDDSWGTSDHEGHGTEMAGIAAFYDLKEKLLSDTAINVRHKIESVKILPPTGENDPELYGAVTEQAVALAEIENPNAERSICMAVTAPGHTAGDGAPSSWSGAVDSLTSGADSDDGAKRLLFVSAGNVQPLDYMHEAYPDAIMIHSVENPGQSWNAVTVGAYNKSLEIQDDAFRGFKPLADVDQISPYSSSSVTWDSKWPIKPEILLDGGNIATNGTDYSNCADLSLLTTNRNFTVRPFSSIWATSSATAQGAWMAAQIFAEYPGIWPETVRGLLIHSARWPEKMQSQFCKDSKKKSRGILLRSCGYGIPSLERATRCTDNSVNMIIQGELKPYQKNDGRVVTNEMDIHRLPWPKEVLADLGEVDVELRVTLSYFIEPGPGEIGWKDRYRYPSCGLRFDLINENETEEDFMKRVNVKSRGDDIKDTGDGSSGSERWFLGSKNRDVGSIHSDSLCMSAASLSEMNILAVYPVSGWWKERAYLQKYDNKIRYSLIVTISTPKQDVDFYTPIITQIQNPVEIDIPTA